MSFLVNLLCRGNNQPSSRGFAAWLGRRLALRNPRVTIAPDAAISPAAMIHPRSGAVEIGARSMVSPVPTVTCCASGMALYIGMLSSIFSCIARTAAASVIACGLMSLLTFLQIAFALFIGSLLSRAAR